MHRCTCAQSFDIHICTCMHGGNALVCIHMYTLMFSCWASLPQPSSSLFSLQSTTPSQRTAWLGQLSTGSLYLIPVWPLQKWTGTKEAGGWVTTRHRDKTVSSPRPLGVRRHRPAIPLGLWGSRPPSVWRERLLRTALECSKKLLHQADSSSQPLREKQREEKEEGDGGGYHCGTVGTSL